MGKKKPREEASRGFEEGMGHNRSSPQIPLRARLKTEPP
jgi:hypothetical protein